MFRYLKTNIDTSDRAPSELRAVSEECLVPDRAADDRVFKIQNGRHGTEDWSR